MGCKSKCLLFKLKATSTDYNPETAEKWSWTGLYYDIMYLNIILMEGITA